MLTDSPEAIINAIRLAFANVARGKVTLHEADAIDLYCLSHKELEEARQLDPDNHWDQVPDDDIKQLPDIFHFLDAASWRYYVPAYIVWALQNYRSTQSRSSDTVVHTLQPPLEDEDELLGNFLERLRSRDQVLSFNKPQFSEYRNQECVERFSLLDQPQSEAVCRFLCYMATWADKNYADDDAARIALDNYWGRFCEEASDITA